jgi:hypothetical protein
MLVKYNNINIIYIYINGLTITFNIFLTNIFSTIYLNVKSKKINYT